MNYLVELQRLRRIEEEKKARLERIKEDKEKNKIKYLSNVTFIAFEKYILERLPYFIEEGLKKGLLNNKVEIRFNFTKGIHGHILGIGSIPLEEVNKEEFLAYIKSIPGHISSKESSWKYTEIFKLDTLITYYYEKLQEFEYYGIDYSGRKSR